MCGEPKLQRALLQFPERRHVIFRECRGARDACWTGTNEDASIASVRRVRTLTRVPAKKGGAPEPRLEAAVPRSEFFCIATAVCLTTQQSTFATCLKPLPVLLLLFDESISVIQRGSVNDSRAAAFRHGAVVARKGSLVMNQYVQLPVQTIRSPVQL